MDSKPLTFFVEEWSKIVSGDSSQNFGDCLTLPRAYFEDLVEFVTKRFLNGDRKLSKVFELTNHRGKPMIRVKNYIGVIQINSRFILEIGPKMPILDIEKTMSYNERTKLSRQAMLRLFSVSSDINEIQFQNAMNLVKKGPLLDQLVSMFLSNLRVFFDAGLKFDYSRKFEKEKFVKGKVLFSSSSQESFFNKSVFFCEYEHFTEDIAPNRLILECLSFLESRITVLELKQEISELFKWLENVNRSMNIQNDFRDYENNPKWVLEYASIMPFVTLILSGYQLIPMAGNLPGISILYPSEKLFESFIATLISIVQPDWKIRRKERSQFIFDDGSANLRFNGLWMEPDLVSHRKKLIMDTKWKILNERSDFLGISSSDLYQVYTYVSTYSNKSVSSWKVCLIYPGFQNQTKGFRLKTMDGFKFMIYRFDMNSSNLRKEITEMITFFERDLYVKNSSV